MSFVALSRHVVECSVVDFWDCGTLLPTKGSSPSKKGLILFITSRPLLSFDCLLAPFSLSPDAFSVLQQCIPLPICNHPSVLCSAEDCDLKGGEYVTMKCPHYHILMEHCYTCYHYPNKEVIVCDGFGKEDILAQCASPVRLQRQLADAQ